MRITHIVPRALTNQATRGSQSRIMCINDALQNGHEVQTFSSGRIGTYISKHLTLAGDKKPLATIGHLCNFSSLRKAVKWSDVMIVEFPWAFTFCRTNTTPIIYSSHNVEVDKFASYAEVLKRPPLPYVSLAYIAERFAVNNADIIIAVSEEDRARFSDVYNFPSERIWVLANGSMTVQLPTSTLNEKKQARQTLALGREPVGIFLGGTDAPPNREGFRLITSVAKRLKNVQFIVTGHVAPKQRYSNLSILGNIPDIRLALSAADFALCPIKFGGGTKIKLLDSTGFGLPTICFQESLRGFPSAFEQHVILCPSSVDGLTKCIESVVENLNIFESFGAAARQYVSLNYSWQQVANLLARHIVERYGHKLQ